MNQLNKLNELNELNKLAVIGSHRLPLDSSHYLGYVADFGL